MANLDNLQEQLTPTDLEGAITPANTPGSVTLKPVVRVEGGGVYRLIRVEDNYPIKNTIHPKEENLDKYVYVLDREASIQQKEEGKEKEKAEGEPIESEEAKTGEDTEKEVTEKDSEDSGEAKERDDGAGKEGESEKAEKVDEEAGKVSEGKEEESKYSKEELDKLKFEAIADALDVTVSIRGYFRDVFGINPEDFASVVGVLREEHGDLVVNHASRHYVGAKLGEQLAKKGIKVNSMRELLKRLTESSISGSDVPDYFYTVRDAYQELGYSSNVATSLAKGFYDFIMDADVRGIYSAMSHKRTTGGLFSAISVNQKLSGAIDKISRDNYLVDKYFKYIGILNSEGLQKLHDRLSIEDTLERETKKKLAEKTHKELTEKGSGIEVQKSDSELGGIASEKWLERIKEDFTSTGITSTDLMVPKSILVSSDNGTFVYKNISSAIKYSLYKPLFRVRDNDTIEDVRNASTIKLSKLLDSFDSLIDSLAEDIEYDASSSEPYGVVIGEFVDKLFSNEYLFSNELKRIEASQSLLAKLGLAVFVKEHNLPLDTEWDAGTIDEAKDFIREHFGIANAVSDMASYQTDVAAIFSRAAKSLAIYELQTESIRALKDVGSLNMLSFKDFSEVVSSNYESAKAYEQELEKPVESVADTISNVLEQAEDVIEESVKEDEEAKESEDTDKEKKEDLSEQEEVQDKKEDRKDISPIERLYGSEDLLNKFGVKDINEISLNIEATGKKLILAREEVSDEDVSPEEKEYRFVITDPDTGKSIVFDEDSDEYFDIEDAFANAAFPTSDQLEKINRALSAAELVAKLYEDSTGEQVLARETDDVGEEPEEPTKEPNEEPVEIGDALQEFLEAKEGIEEEPSETSEEKPEENIETSINDTETAEEVKPEPETVQEESSVTSSDRISNITAESEVEPSKPTETSDTTEEVGGTEEESSSEATSTEEPADKETEPSEGTSEEKTTEEEPIEEGNIAESLINNPSKTISSYVTSKPKETINSFVPILEKLSGRRDINPTINTAASFAAVTPVLNVIKDAYKKKDASIIYSLFPPKDNRKLVNLYWSEPDSEGKPKYFSGKFNREKGTFSKPKEIDPDTFLTAYQDLPNRLSDDIKSAIDETILDMAENPKVKQHLLEARNTLLRGRLNELEGKLRKYETGSVPKDIKHEIGLGKSPIVEELSRFTIPTDLDIHKPVEAKDGTYSIGDGKSYKTLDEAFGAFIDSLKEAEKAGEVPKGTYNFFKRARDVETKIKKEIGEENILPQEVVQEVNEKLDKIIEDKEGILDRLKKDIPDKLIDKLIKDTYFDLSNSPVPDSTEEALDEIKRLSPETYERLEAAINRINELDEKEGMKAYRENIDKEMGIKRDIERYYNQLFSEYAHTDKRPVKASTVAKKAQDFVTSLQNYGDIGTQTLEKLRDILSNELETDIPDSISTKDYANLLAYYINDLRKRNNRDPLPGIEEIEKKVSKFFKTNDEQLGEDVEEREEAKNKETKNETTKPELKEKRKESRAGKTKKVEEKKKEKGEESESVELDENSIKSAIREVYGKYSDSTKPPTEGRVKQALRTQFKKLLGLKRSDNISDSQVKPLSNALGIKAESLDELLSEIAEDVINKYEERKSQRLKEEAKKAEELGSTGEKVDNEYDIGELRSGISKMVEDLPILPKVLEDFREKYGEFAKWGKKEFEELRKKLKEAFGKSSLGETLQQYFPEGFIVEPPKVEEEDEEDVKSLEDLEGPPEEELEDLEEEL